MKARLPIPKDMKSRLIVEVQKEVEKRNEDNARRMFKLVCSVLNRRYGFGKGRLTDMVIEVSKLIEQAKNDEVFWYHRDKQVIDQIGMQFDRENYEEWDR